HGADPASRAAARRGRPEKSEAGARAAASVTTPADGADPANLDQHTGVAKPGIPQSAGGARNLGGHAPDRGPCARTSQPELLGHAARDAHHDEPSPVFSQRLRWSGPAVGLPGLEPGTSSLSGIEGSALCGPAFSQVAGERRGRRDAFLAAS